MSNWFFENDKTTSKETKAPSQEPDRDYDFTGTFECQTCGFYVHGAYLRRDNSTLDWYCPSGHISTIEEFQ